MKSLKSYRKLIIKEFKTKSVYKIEYPFKISITMKTKKKKLKKLLKSARHQFDTLQPSDIQKNQFKATYLQFEGYLDLFITIEALINVIILATQGDSYSPPHIKNHGRDIRKNLELAKTLLPFDEGEFLDDLNAILKQPK
tara:strand:- start:8970 stop:9389 length:420 start_codon:yes stop_codon:yes gene_type:complete